MQKILHKDCSWNFVRNSFGFSFKDTDWNAFQDFSKGSCLFTTYISKYSTFNFFRRFFQVPTGFFFSRFLQFHLKFLFGNLSGFLNTDRLRHCPSRNCSQSFTCVFSKKMSYDFSRVNPWIFFPKMSSCILLRCCRRISPKFSPEIWLEIFSKILFIISKETEFSNEFFL